ncbi:unnamed protein product [Sphagnum jensenii]
MCIAQLEEQFLLLRMNPRTVECVNTPHMEMFQEGLAQQWINVTENSGSCDSDYFKNAASSAQEYFKSMSKYYKYHSMVVVDPKGQSGHGHELMEYYNQCKPLYCDVTRPNSLFRHIYLAVAQLAGLAALLFILHHCIVQPLLARLLSPRGAES